ncbi:MAG TPA: hypothetical protein PKD46_09275 [Aggregatilineaceae bacterium]|nr:hypothetical protein [Aggregatilineaceae bacterium]
MEPQTAAYLAELPEVRTSRLPRGALFWANGSIYEVSAVDARGFQKARLWRQAEHTEVALVPGSLLSRHLPVVAQGRALPVYHSQNDLLDAGECSCYVFPTEMLALDAAYLDAALILRSGPYVRQQEAVPAFALTDGIHLFRLYYFRQSTHGRPTDLSSLRDRSAGFRPRPHAEGPGFWRLLPSWTEQTNQFDTTQQSLPAVRIDLPEPPAP